MNLLGSTGDARADAILRTTIEAFEAAFPERVRGYYLHGSLADGTGLPTSDLDLAIIFCGQMRAAGECAAVHLRSHARLRELLPWHLSRLPARG
ncbi:MAG TPA: nucleotidyltransferase domain-containing protein, partial [Ktedonobacterales bacterium]|nr:nucleotidyltransferase domain-containing protein [Ktedonobacterales bacterium]